MEIESTDKKASNTGFAAEDAEHIEEGEEKPSKTPVKVVLHKVETSTGCHTILEMPSLLPDDVGTLAHKPQDTFNILMADVSGSMYEFWPLVLQTWNDHISKKLIGRTKIYTFGCNVTFRREDTFLVDEDFDQASTNLTEGIETIGREITNCREEFARVFLITDGHHNASHKQPDKAINKLKIPNGKTVEVFLVGVGCSFPVEYSISLRSTLHNGNANLPSIFWAKETEDYENEMLSIADILSQGYCKFKISPLGCVVPGLDKTEVAHLGEFLYYALKPEELKLELYLEEYGKILTEEEVNEPDLSLFLDKVFRQWNSIIIQEHRKGKDIPHVAFGTMEEIYNHYYSHEEGNFKEKNPDNTIETRLKRKFLKTMKVEYETLMNKSKTVIGLEGKYKTELELAQNILKTTVKSKYDTKNLKMKGHSEDDYGKDIKVFMEVVEDCRKKDLMKLDHTDPDNCCSVTFASTVSDLKDSSLELLAQEDKFTFMKTFNVTGIPVYAPIRDSSQINPWTLRIKKVLASPYTIVSQTTLELSAESGMTQGIEDKDIYLQEGDENSRFNAIVPVFTRDANACLKPIITTNIFQMVASFCILKNPHIIDHNAHIAALASVWTKTISDHPLENRPEYVKSRLDMIEATAANYLDRKGIALYISILLQKPQQALMTESKESFFSTNLKCESLTKPIFFLYLNRMKDSFKEKRIDLFRLIAAEFIGRCLAGRHSDNVADNEKGKKIKSSQLQQQNQNVDQSSNIADDSPEDTILSKSNNFPYLEFFVSKEENVEDFLAKKVDGFLADLKLQGGELMSQYYTREDLLKGVKARAIKHLESQMRSLFEIKVNFNKVKGLRNAGATGDLVWKNLAELAKEVGILPEELKDIFGPEQTLVYVHHGLRLKNSKDRMDTPLPTYEQAFKAVGEWVRSETATSLKHKLIKKVKEEANTLWIGEYKSIHKLLFYL